MNMFELVWCSKNYFRVRSMFNKMVFNPSLRFFYPMDLLIYCRAVLAITFMCASLLSVGRLLRVITFGPLSSKPSSSPRARNQQFIFTPAYIAQDFIKRSQYCRKCYVKQKGLSKVGVTWYSNTWCMKLIWLRITFCLYVLRASLVSDLLARIGVS